MQFVGLFFEILFLCFGVYIYKYATGALNFKNKEAQAKANEFREENGTWMKYGALILIAIMSIEIFLNVKSLF